MEYLGKSYRSAEVLVTGGAGFIGSRLVEMLIKRYNANVRVLVSSYKSVAYIARFPIKVVAGDITDPAVVEKAVQGAKIVFHCAFGNKGDENTQAHVNVQGTLNVLNAALKYSVDRVVHVSTLAVYETSNATVIDESSPKKKVGDIYSMSKLRAEEYVQEYVCKYDLPATIIQPSIVYGPNGRLWTEGILKTLQRRKFILIDGGSGPCNLVYVDDLVDGLLRAGEKDTAIGESFLISANEPVTWADFIGGYEKIIGRPCSVSMSRDEAIRFTQQTNNAGERGGKKPQKKVDKMSVRYTKYPLLVNVKDFCRPHLYTLLRKFTHNPHSNVPKNRKVPVSPLSAKLIELQCSRGVVSIEKAKRLLGYNSRYSLGDAMKIIQRWAEWSNIIRT